VEKSPKIVANFVYASSQRQHTHSARTKIQTQTLHLNAIANLVKVEKFIFGFDNNATNICNNRTIVLLVNEVALLLVMVAVGTSPWTEVKGK
jgi:hypothetical protein